MLYMHDITNAQSCSSVIALLLNIHSDINICSMELQQVCILLSGYYPVDNHVVSVVCIMKP